MALIERYVNTASSPGGTGTSNATSGADRAYASLAEWEAAEQADLVATGNQHTVYCTGVTADTNRTIDGWTTGAGNRITIIGDPLSPTYDTSKYRIECANSCIILKEAYVTFRNLQLYMSSATLNSQAAVYAQSGSGGGLITIENCMLRGPLGDSTHQYLLGIAAYGSGGANITIWNCAIYDWGVTSEGGGIVNWDAGGTFNCYNCTVYGGVYGIYRATPYSAGPVYAYNCAVQNCQFSLKSVTNDYCIADDIPNSYGAHTQTEITLIFNDLSGRDFRFDPDEDTEAIGTGLDDPSSGLYSDDITGATRTSPWDIGAFGYFPSSGGIEESIDISMVATLSGAVQVMSGIDTTLIALPVLSGLLGSPVSLTVQPSLGLAGATGSPCDIGSSAVVSITPQINGSAAVTVTVTIEAPGRVSAEIDCKTRALIEAAAEIASTISPESVVSIDAHGSVVGSIELTAEAIAELVCATLFVLSEILGLSSPITTCVNCRSGIAVTVDLDSEMITILDLESAL